VKWKIAFGTDSPAPGGFFVAQTLKGKTMLKTEDDRKVMAFAVPVAIAMAAETAAAQDVVSVSHVIRQALMRDLRERGLLPARP
jgi:hypothetical protein